jgi:flagellar protein FlaG
MTPVASAPTSAPTPSIPKVTAAAPSASGKSSSPTGGDLPPPVSAADIDRAVQRLSELMSKTQRDLRFQVDEISGRTVITVLDATTKEIVRQIPAPQVLAVARHLEHVGALLDTRG